LENIFSEPSTRDTSACIGLATLRIMKTDPQAIIAILSADHYIGNEKKFRQLLQKAGKLAKRDNKIVILGIKPTRPATEFGYINIGKSGKNIEKTKVFTVKKFVEKPDLPTAKKYIKSWKYFWNAGMFIYPVSVMMEKIAQNMPQNHKILMKISQHLGSKDENNQIKKLYEQMDKISIDYGVLERSSDLLMIPADINWNDIGTWGTLKDMLSNDDSDNITKGNLITIDTTGSLIYGHKKTIITLGVEDMVIVDTDDVMLVCPKNKSADIKKIIELLKNKKLDQYL